MAEAASAGLVVRAAPAALVLPVDPEVPADEAASGGPVVRAVRAVRTVRTVRTENAVVDLATAKAALAERASAGWGEAVVKGLEKEASAEVGAASAEVEADPAGSCGCCR